MNRILITIFSGFGAINMKNVFLFPVRLLQIMIVLQQFINIRCPFVLKGGIEKKGGRYFLKGEGKDSLGN